MKLSKQQAAYIAGFLDGDGSIMLTLVPKDERHRGFRIKSCIILYQDKSGLASLKTIHSWIGRGYLSIRKDNIAELRLEGFDLAREFLKNVFPFLLFKKKQAKYLLQAAGIMLAGSRLDDRTFLSVCKLSDKVASYNYKSRRKYTYAYVKTHMKRSS